MYMDCNASECTISSRRTLPSFVILIIPAPLTSIFMVPDGPRLLFTTDMRDLAAWMFIARAWFLPMISAFGFTVFTYGEKT